MALENMTSHFSTMLEPVASASFLSSLSIIHDLTEGFLRFRFGGLIFGGAYFFFLIYIEGLIFRI